MCMFEEICDDYSKELECDKVTCRWPTCRPKKPARNTEPLAVNSEFAGYTPEKLAEKFHTVYESFAPAFGYKTRKESAVAWEDVPEQNKKLMIRVCKSILDGE